MTTSETNWETAKVEYEIALEEWRHYANLRRQDMAFVTTIQGAVLTIVGSKLLRLDAPGLLSITAFFVLLLGINSERRLSAYMTGYIRRAREIESEHGMSLLPLGWDEVKSRKLLFSNRIVFPLYYFVFILVWVSIWALNLLN